ncbi:MAG: hypothetical protein ACYTHJ_12460 [Planctomycetota bacterium]
MKSTNKYWAAFTVMALLTGGCEKDTAPGQSSAESGREESPTPTEVEPAEIIANPTTNAGRGAPSLTSLHAPAAWIYVDNKEGEFNEEDGRPQVEWTIFEQCSRNPTFRVEAYEPLLGRPDQIQFVLRTHESFDGTYILYTVKSKGNSFVAGKEYALLDPGADFVITNQESDTSIQQIPLLSPGVYSIVASVKSSETGKEGLAISHFSVGAE